jgi:mitochondrial intermediate peptidase
MKFLYSLSEANRPWVQKEMAPFKEDKIQTEGNPYLNMWDRDFYARRYKQSHAHQRKLLEDPLVPYLSVGTVIRGLSRLFTRLYGIRFVPKETQLGEVWHPQVRRLDVFDENGQIGIIYCDLFHRAGQRDSPPAHYTIRCSRRVDPGEAEDALTRNGYQLPIIALKCDFKPNYQGIGFLIWSEVETLFHEMGHAMHCSLLLEVN